MITVQKDVYSAFADFLAKQMVAAFDKKKNGEREAVDLLRGWSGQMEKGTAAPLVVGLAYEELQKKMIERAAPGANQGSRPFMAPAVIETLLRQRPPGWFSDYDDVLLDSLKKGIATGMEEQGSKLSRWDYGQWNELRLLHPVLSQVPLVGKYFNIGPVPMSGSGTTIKQTTRRLGSSMRMAVDLADLDNSTQNITVGESGQALSRHYKDQWGAYYGATSFPMQFDKVEARQVLRVRPK
jgi:penicillin amidase